MQDEIAISIDNVSKDFLLPHEKTTSVKSLFTRTAKRGRTQETQHALKNISFEIKKGEFFGIVGRNGSGKSTLLKILAGIYQPTSGTVKVHGKLVPFIELGVGFNPELTGRENVYLNGAMLGFSEDEIGAMYEDIVRFAELNRFMDQKLKNYSSGMQVRLAFSMATRSDADILLIDEVLAVGDADFQRKCFEYFKTLKKNKKTVVFVSHDMAAVKEFCDRAALIEKNELKDIGNTSMIADQYTSLFVGEGVGDKDLNTLNRQARQGNGAVSIEDVQVNKKVYNDSDETINLNVTLKVNSSTSQLMTGFAVKDSQGLYINSAHSWSLRDDLGLGQKEAGNITWTIPNIYEEGLYSIDVYAMGSNHMVYDRINDALNFRVKRKQRSNCLLVLPVKIRINNEELQEIKP